MSSSAYTPSKIRCNAFDRACQSSAVVVSFVETFTYALRPAQRTSFPNAGEATKRTKQSKLGVGSCKMYKQRSAGGTGEPYRAVFLAQRKPDMATLILLPDNESGFNPWPKERM